MDNLTKSAEKKINEGARRVQEDGENTRRHALDVLEEKFERGEELLEEIKAGGEKFWNKTKSKSRELWGSLAEDAQAKWGQTRQYVRENPAKSLGIAALAGLVVGIFAFSKRRQS